MRLISMLLALVLVTPQPDPDIVWLAKINYQETYDSQGIQFFELRKGAEAPLLSVQGSSELAAFLRRHDGKRITVTFSAVSLEQ
jgi:hypothetical protein